MPTPPPPPPLPPPGPPSEAMPQLNPITNSITSGTDSRQNLLKEIQKGMTLRKVDQTVVNKIKRSDSMVSLPNQNQSVVPTKGPIMTSLAKELEERTRRKSLDNFGSKTGPQSYYRWTNNTNNSILNQRTQFKAPPVPIDHKEVAEPIDSDFSDNEDEEEENYSPDDRLNLLRSLKNSEPIQPNLIINRSNSLSYDSNQSMKTRPIITDIYHIID